MSPLRLSLLGPVSITNNDKSLSHFPRKSALALLIYLTEIGPKHAPTREYLGELLWPWMAPENGRQNLRQTLYEIKKSLPVQENPAPILITRHTLQRNPQAYIELDTQIFEQTLQTPTLENLQQAVTLYRGDFLTDFYLPDSTDFENWVHTRREYYRRHYQEALGNLITLSPANPDYARRLLESDPFHEEAARKLMQMLAKNGARTEALQVYETLRQQLKNELGVKPQAETIDIYEAILSGKLEFQRIPTDIPAKPRPPLHLPISLTPFIGRRPEVEQIKAFVQNPAHRLITLTGPGGVGKTRLSIQAASEVGDAFPDGVFFAPFAPVQTVEGVLSALALAVDFSFYQEDARQKQLLDFLREKRLLLILDNFEHLLNAAPLVSALLTNAPEVKLIVTSRIRLNVWGEQLYPVSGMHTPNIEEASHWDDPETQVKSFSGMQLFLDCARRVRPDFTLTPETLAPMVEICQLVQGMPLALELAAAWLELLGPKEIAEEIRRSLDFLETDQAGVPVRQRSIRAVFESSWKLLNAGEREAFLRLCVFVGSFSREAAQQVSGNSLKTLLGLANKSWIQQTEGGRFQLHELMRQYGEERLKANPAAWIEAKTHHANYFAQFVAGQSERMKGPDQRAGANAVELEFETNIRAAWDWLVEEKRWEDIFTHLITGLFQAKKVRNRYFELHPWLRDARLSMTALPEGERDLAAAMIGAVELDVEEAAQYTDPARMDRLRHIWEVVREQGLEERLGLWFVFLAGVVWQRNLDPEVKALLGKAVDRLREQGKAWELGWALTIQAGTNLLIMDEKQLLEAQSIFQKLGPPLEQGIVAEFLGDLARSQNRSIAEVENYFRQASAFYLTLGDHFYLPTVNLAYYYLKCGETEKAFTLLREQQQKYEQIGNLWCLASDLHWESLFAVRYSTRDHAVTTRNRTTALWKKLGIEAEHPANFAFTIYALGEAYRIFGETEKAREVFARARTGFEKANLEQGLGFWHCSQGDMALKEGRFTEALDHYQKYNEYFVRENHIWGITQSYGKLALAYAYLGHLAAARTEMRKSLGYMRALREFDLELMALLAEPVCLIKEGKFGQAIELAAFIANHPVSWNETRWQAQELLDWAAQGLSEEMIQAAMERGKSLQLESVIQPFLHP